MPSEAPASALPLEKKKPSRRQRASALLNPTTDPNTSSIVQTAAKPSELTTAPVEKISKSDCVLRLLKRDSGATIGDIMAATNWQAHSVRGFLSGTVRKKMGVNLLREVTGEGARRYRIEGGYKTDNSNDVPQLEPTDLPAFLPSKVDRGAKTIAADMVS